MQRPSRRDLFPALLGFCVILFLCFFLLMLWTLWGPLMGKGAGLLNAAGSPVGGDFSQFYVASAVTRAQGARQNYDESVYQQEYQKIIGGQLNYRWVYPPSFLLLVYPLSLMPYTAALAVWLAATLVFYLLAMPRLPAHFLGVWLSLAFPAVFLNALNGQNGFLTAGLWGAGLLLLKARPWSAGLVLGCLSYKPHLALLLPLALVAGGHWRALGGACLSVAGLAAVSSLVFGWSVWPEFCQSLGRSLDLLGKAGPLWEKMISVYAAAMLAGLGQHWAWFLQGLVTAAVCGGVLWLWRIPGPERLRYAGVVLGSLLATPQAYYYDLALLALPLTWLALEGLEQG